MALIKKPKHEITSLKNWKLAKKTKENQYYSNNKLALRC